MKEALVSKGPKVEIIDSPIPVPEPDQVVTKVVVSGSNPKDWKRPEWTGQTLNQGDDIAGVVHAVGSNVVEFKEGDRVAAFHQMGSPGGSYAEYAVSWAHATFHIPKKTSFEEAATIPLAAMTAAFALFQRLHLPTPWHPTLTPIPVIIYGAATAVGSFAIQLAQQANIHPLICVAGRGIPHVQGLIDESKGDIVLDYRVGDGQLVQNLRAAVQNAGGKVEYAFDAVSENGSYENICKILDHKTGKITLVLPGKDYNEIPETIEKSRTSVGSAQIGSDTEPWQKKTGMMTGNEEFAMAFFRYFGRGLQKGFFKGHPYEVVPGGLAGVQGALQNLKDGKASAVKYVFRLEDTDGVPRYSTN
ncbi:hypothetical protein ACLMJK_003917 [Lecanora helva]